MREMAPWTQEENRAVEAQRDDVSQKEEEKDEGTLQGPRK